MFFQIFMKEYNTGENVKYNSKVSGTDPVGIYSESSESVAVNGNAESG